jgi:predicted CoA-binding protein
MQDATTDTELKRILQSTKVIAAIGVSPNPVRPSNYVVRYLNYRGFRVIPVNPVATGQVIYGETVLSDFSEIPADAQVDMVEIFRRSEFVPEIVESAIAYFPDLRTIWMQIGVMHDGAAETARARGLTVVQDRCPKIEYQRLSGELRRAGFNTGIISSKLSVWD